MNTFEHAQGPYALVAEFTTDEQLKHAARRAREAGYTHMDAYSPFPVNGLDEDLALPRSRVPLVVLIGGILGGLGGFFLQYWSQVIRYPINIGGRPFNSWPAFIVPTFEMTILGAAVIGVIGMFLLNGLPQPYHPMFNWDHFQRASRDRFFLAIEAEDPKYDRQGTESFLRSLEPSEVMEVES